MGFSFKDNFCKNFIALRDCFEVFISFNIDQYLLKLTDKISILLYYDEKLDLEEEKRQLDQFANSVNVVGKSLAELQLKFLIFIVEAYFS